VKLVGFEGEGYRKFVLHEDELQRYIDTSGINLHAHPYAVFAPPNEFRADHTSLATGSNQRHGNALPFKQKYLFKVSKASPELTRAVNTAIQEVVDVQAEKHEKYRAYHYSQGVRQLPRPADKIWYHIPHRVVERVLQQDFETSKLHYTIYLLNPKVPTVKFAQRLEGIPTDWEGDFDDEANIRAKVGKRVPVRYVYSERDEVSAQTAEDFTKKVMPTCESVVWASRRRFAFIDLMAGPVTYGPQTMGDGIFTEMSLPRLDRLFHRHRKETKKTFKREEKRRKREMQDERDAAKAKLADMDEEEITEENEEVKAALEILDYHKLSKEEKRKARKLDMLAKGHEFMAEIARAVRRTTESLIGPPLWHLPVKYHRRIVVNLVVVTDHEYVVEHELARWKLMTARLQDLAVADQDVEVSVSQVSFDQCELCVAAFSHATKSHTSNFIAGENLKTQMHLYLDSGALHDWLEHFERGFWSMRSGVVKRVQELHADKKKLEKNEKLNARRARRGALGGDTEEDLAKAETATVTTKAKKVTKATQVKLDDDELLDDDVRVVNAFVFDLKTTDVLLLDRFHQSVSFPDLVVAVQTRAPLTQLDSTCNGQPMKFDPADASRALFASLLQTLWGVAPTGVLFNPYLNQTETDFMWTVGLTPFGHFSQMMDSSFAIRDSIARNVVYSELTEALNELKAIQVLALHYRRNPRDLMGENLSNFIERYNMLQFKLQKTQSLISMNRFNEALYYLRPARHDVKAIHNLLLEAVGTLQPILTCTKAERRDLRALRSSRFALVGSLWNRVLVLGETLFAMALLLYLVYLSFFRSSPPSSRPRSSQEYTRFDSYDSGRGFFGSQPSGHRMDLNHSGSAGSWFGRLFGKKSRLDD